MRLLYWGVNKKHHYAQLDEETIHKLQLILMHCKQGASNLVRIHKVENLLHYYIQTKTSIKIYHHKVQTKRRNKRIDSYLLHLKKEKTVRNSQMDLKLKQKAKDLVSVWMSIQLNERGARYQEDFLRDYLYTL